MNKGLLLGTIYVNGNPVKEDVLLIRITRDYYFCVELQEGFWNHALEENESYVGNIRTTFLVEEKGITRTLKGDKNNAN